MDSFGVVARFTQTKDCFVFEFVSFDDAHTVLQSSKDNPEAFIIDGHALTPIFGGVPKRNYSTIKRKRDAVEKNLETAKLNKQRKKQAVAVAAVPLEAQAQYQEESMGRGGGGGGYNLPPGQGYSGGFAGYHGYGPPGGFQGGPGGYVPYPYGPQPGMYAPPNQ